jgi:hypothetical protein
MLKASIGGKKMESVRKKAARKRHGAVLILSMIFVLVFSALAVSFSAFSGTNVQLGENQRKANQALASAESGMEIIRFWLDGIYVPSIVAESQRKPEIPVHLRLLPERIRLLRHHKYCTCIHYRADCYTGSDDGFRK